MESQRKITLAINARFLTQQITGTQRFAIEISKRLKKNLNTVQFVAPPNITHKSLQKELNAQIVGKTTSHLWEQTTLPLYLKKQSNPLLLNLVNTAPFLYKKQIVTIHDLAFLRNPRWFSKTFYLYYRLLIPYIARHSLKILTVSYFSKKEIIDLLGINEDKIEVIYNAVDNKFRYNPEIKKEKYILTVSSIDPRKNLKNLLLAFKNLKLKNYKLIIAGSKNKIFNDIHIKEILHNIPNVEIIGHVNDNELVMLYQKATLFVFPSFYEGFGLPPLEAMASGTPVIVSNTASLPEICGDAAYYIDPWSIESIAKGIQEVLNNKDLQAKLIHKGIKRAKAFSWERSADKLTEVVEKYLYI